MEPQRPPEGPPSINIPEGAQIQDLHVHYNELAAQQLLQNQQQLQENQRELLQRLPEPQQPQQNPIQADLLQAQQTLHTPRLNIQTLAKELQEKLNDNAKEVSEQFVLPIDIERTIKRVNLQICKVKQHADKDWEIEASSLEWRMCMERKHAQTVYGTTEPRISIQKIFDTAKKIATDEAERKFKDENSKKAYIKKHGNIVGLTGLPGIGKTTLTQMVTQSILANSILPDTQYLFYILTRNVNFENKVSVSQFLIENSLPGQAYSDEEYKAITQELQNNPNVVIVLDGLDEAGVPFSTTTHCCQLDTKEKPVDIIKSLFNAILLPNAVKLVTSRPGQFYQIHQDYRPTIVLEVLGLDKAAQEELIKQLCGEEKYPGIEELLEQKANLSALCYVPVNCIYIIDSLLSGVGDINSMTQVLILTLTKYIYSGVLKNMDKGELKLELIKLTKLAFRGFEEKKVVFDINDFEEVQLPDSVVANFLHTYVEQSTRIKMKILDGKKRSYFAHLTLQEFFCGIYVMLFMPYESLIKKRSIFNDVHWDVVVRFMFGLCNSSAYKEMRDIFPASRIRDFDMKKKMLSEIVSCQDLCDNNTLFKVAGWVNESNDKKISTKFDNTLSSDVKLKLPNDPSKVQDVALALKSCSAIHNLSVEACETTEAPIFFRGLQHSTNLKIKQLKLEKVDMTNITEYLVQRINDIDRLELSRCNHVGAAMKELGPAINERSNKIDLHIQSDLDNDGAKALGKCLRNISKLVIKEQWIPVQSRIILREAVQQLPNPQDLVVDVGEWGKQNGDQYVKTWAVYYGDEADDVKQILQLEPGKGWYKDLEMRDIVGYLLPHMKVLDELQLYKCGRLIVGLSQAIDERQNKMVLDISGSYLDEAGAEALGDCLRNISNLRIHERRISVQSRIILREAVQQLPNPQDLVVVDDDGCGKQDGTQWVKTWKVYGRDKADDRKRIFQLKPGKVVEQLHAQPDYGLLMDTTQTSHIRDSCSKTIGPKGDTIEVGGCALIVPDGALDKDVIITLTASLDLDRQAKSSLTPTLQCEPSSLKFNLPVKIFLQTHYILDKESLTECKIQTSQDGINWNILECDLSINGRSTMFTTNHFTWFKVLCDRISGKIEIVSDIYIRGTQLVWAIYHNLALNTKQLSENYILSHTYCISANKDLTLTIEEDKPLQTITIRPPYTKINHDDLTTKIRRHTPFYFENLPEGDVYLKATLRNEEKDRDFHVFKLPKKRPTDSSSLSNQPTKKHTIMNNCNISNSAVGSDGSNIGGNS